MPSKKAPINKAARKKPPGKKAVNKDDTRTERASISMFERTFHGKDRKEIIYQCRGIDPQTLNRVKRGGRVFLSTLSRLARCTKTRIADWIQHDDRIALPAGRKFFESLQWSYYLSHDEEGDGMLAWREEQMTVQFLRRTMGGKVPLTMRFRGIIRSTHHGKEKVFRYVASKSNEYYLGLVAHSTTHDGLAFHAIMSHVVEGVLCGLWVGLSPKGHRMAVYRMLLSPRRLSGVELDRISNEAPVEHSVYVVSQVASTCIAFDDEKKSG